MTRSRMPTDPYHPSIHELARSAGVPVLVMDHQLTRRQRIHTVVFPGDERPYASTRMAECLEAAMKHGPKRCILADLAMDGTLQACYIDVTPYKPEEKPHG